VYFFRRKFLNNIEVKDCTYEYVRRDENDEVVEKLSAISHLNFTIEEGSFVCVLGHNGSGKSTLAKLFNALQIPTEGCVIISGMDSREEANVFPIREKVGMVFQNPDNQIIASVVEEDVGFGPENIGIPTDDMWKRVDAALEAVGMTAYRYKSPNKLSGGQRRLLSFVLSLIGKPSILFLDEPTAGMDTSTRIRFWEIVNTLKNNGLTIIYSSHYIEEVEHTADRILVLNKGELIRDTTPHAMRAEEVEKFFTLPIKFLEVIENNPEIYNLEIKRDSFNFLTKKTDLIWNTLQKSGCTLNDLEIQNRTLLDSIFNTTKEQ